MSEITNPIRKWRTEQGLSLEAMCDLFAERGFERPSIAKLSRIETTQYVPNKMIPQIAAITGIPAKKQRPDLAKMFEGEGESA